MNLHLRNDASENLWKKTWPNWQRKTKANRKAQRKKSLKFFSKRTSSATKPGPSWHTLWPSLMHLCVVCMHQRRMATNLISGILNISLKYISIRLSDERGLERVWKNFLMKSFKNWPHTVRPPCEPTARSRRDPLRWNWKLKTADLNGFEKNQYFYSIPLLFRGSTVCWPTKWPH